MGKWVCPHCKKDTFKSERGLESHLKNHSFCSKQMKIMALVHAQQSVPKLASVSQPKSPQNFATIEAKRQRVCRPNGSITNREAAIARQHARMQQILAQQHNQDLDQVEEDDFPMFDDSTVESEEQEPEENGNDYVLQVDAEPLNMFKEYVLKARKDFGPLEDHEVKAIKLLALLHKKKASLDTYDEVIEWHLRATGAIKSNETLADAESYINRKSLIKRLAIRYNMDPNNLVLTREIILPSSRSKAKIVYHDARDLVVSLLTDPRLQDEHYCFFDDDPLAPPPDNFEFIGDVITGTSYRKTYQKLITEPGRQLLVPLIGYIDGAVTGQFDKLEVTAFKFTFGIFNRKARDLLWIWKTLGVVPNYSKEASRAKKMMQESQHIAGTGLYLSDGEGEDDNAEDSAHNAQDFHSLMAAILESYGKLEKKSLLWDLNYKGKLYRNVELVFYIAFIKCDTSEADKLCGQFRSRTKKISMLCRYCCMPQEHTDNKLARYPYKTVPQLQELQRAHDVEALKKLSQQPIENAFHSLRFGLQNNRGIHGACPLEMLHALLLGMFMRLRECFFDQIGPDSRTAEEINSLSKLYGRLFTRQSDRDLPKTHFAKGIKKGKIMAKEFSGVLLDMAVILESTLGKLLLTKGRGNDIKGEELIGDWQMLIETMLQWEAFLKLDEMEVAHVKRLDRKHRYLMYLIKKVANRSTGMGLKIPKFHCILHIAEDIMMFGVPMNVDTGSNESHHKPTKVAAKLTQKNVATFDEQTELRLVEFHIINLAMCEVNGNALWTYFDEWEAMPKGNAQLEPETQTYGTTIQITQTEDGMVGYQLPGCRAAGKDQIQWEDTIVLYLGRLQNAMQLHGLSEISVKTEHKRMGNIFRGHPGYRQQRERWNDWAIVDWGDYQLPCEIWCFVDLSWLDDAFSLEFEGVQVQKGVYAVVECGLPTPEEGEEDEEIYATKSDLFQPFLKEVEMKEDGTMADRVFYLADVEAIVEPVCVVPDVGSDYIARYFRVTPRREWANLFINWVQQPHNLDDMNE